jgi:phenylpropionate dioxygenase-like ring-hydroxylating dioxygenase large terminal subunit
MYLSPERNKSLAVKLFDHVRNVTTDQTEEVYEYDLAMYMDPALAERERKRIFQRLPMMAAHSSQVAEPGSFITMNLNSSNVLVTRHQDGSLGAYLNICRHRGATVVTKTSGKQSAFMCPYHGWTYSNEGELRTIGFEKTTGLSPCAQRNLVALPVEERHGFIWMVEDPNGTIDVAEHLGPGMDQALREYGFESYFCYREQMFDFPQNWKIMMDGLIDGYHVQFLHGKTISPYFYPNMMGVEIHGRHALWGNPRRSMEKILGEEPGASSLDRYVIFGNLFTPNASMVLHPHHVEFWTVYQDPDNIGACKLHLRYLTPQKEQNEKGVEILARNWEIATAAIINEDVPVGNSIQASAKMPYKGSICLAKNEVTNQLFHRTFRHYMGM